LTECLHQIFCGAAQEGADVFNRCLINSRDCFHAVERDMRSEDYIRPTQQTLIAHQALEFFKSPRISHPHFFLGRRMALQTFDDLFRDNFACRLAHHAFFFEHIEAGACDAAGIERFNQRVGVDDRAARGIYDYDAIATSREGFAVEQMKRLGRKR
jgi:hypothetical protein